tara:strand:+ start:1167 stop:1934 length:768 start_codon:yes stop_codon:yes gene_type:complete
MTYKRSKYFTTTSRKKIKYLYIKKNSQIAVVFFHGFMSDMMGKKPIALERFCKKKKINFLKFEYSGHGKSTGRFIDGNISKWTSEAKQLIKYKIDKRKSLIFIGSSMGSWIALNLFLHFKKQIKGFIGIGSAPNFLEELMWKKFNKKIKKIILKKNIYNLDHGGYIYPITKQLIFDGRKNRVLSQNINLNIPVILLHGTKDRSVPLKFSKKILKFFKKSNGKLIKIKNGDHSLSRKSDLKKICNELKNIIKSKLI